MMNREAILFGDFNIDLLKPKPKWIQTYTMHGLEQLTDRPTRITDQTKTLIDHISVTSKQYITEVCVRQVITTLFVLPSITNVVNFPKLDTNKLITDTLVISMNKIFSLAYKILA